MIFVNVHSPHLLHERSIFFFHSPSILIWPVICYILIRSYSPYPKYWEGPGHFNAKALRSLGPRLTPCNCATNMKLVTLTPIQLVSWIIDYGPLLRCIMVYCYIDLFWNGNEWDLIDSAPASRGLSNWASACMRSDDWDVGGCDVQLGYIFF